MPGRIHIKWVVDSLLCCHTDCDPSSMVFFRPLVLFTTNSNPSPLIRFFLQLFLYTLKMYYNGYFSKWYWFNLRSPFLATLLHHDQSALWCSHILYLINNQIHTRKHASIHFQSSKQKFFTAFISMTWSVWWNQSARENMTQTNIEKGRIQMK